MSTYIITTKNPKIKGYAKFERTDNSELRKKASTYKADTITSVAVLEGFEIPWYNPITGNMIEETGVVLNVPPKSQNETSLVFDSRVALKKMIKDKFGIDLVPTYTEGPIPSLQEDLINDNIKHLNSEVSTEEEEDITPVLAETEDKASIQGSSTINTFVFNVEIENSFNNYDTGILTIVNSDTINYSNTDEYWGDSEEYVEEGFVGEDEVEMTREYVEWMKSDDEVPNSEVIISSPINISAKDAEKIKPIKAAFDHWKVTNIYLKKAILANIKKECGLVPKYEDLNGWKGTSNANIRKYFGSRVKPFSDAELTKLKQNIPKFTEIIYGVYSNRGLGNDKPGDAWKYRGAGYIQLTGKANFKKWSTIAGIDLVANPGILISNPYKSAIVSVAFIIKQIGSPNFTSQSTANRAVTKLIGGNTEKFINSQAGRDLLAKVNDYSNDFGNLV